MPIYEGAQQGHSRGWIKMLLLAALLGGGGFAAYKFAPRQDRQTNSRQPEEPKSQQSEVLKSQPAEAQKATMAESDFYLDYSKPFPWFPAPVASLSPEQIAVMDKLRTIPAYNPIPLVPKKSGTTAAMLDDLERRVDETLLLKVDAKTGAVTGRALVYTGDGGPTESDKAKPANFYTDFYPLFDAAFRAYEGSLPTKKGAPDTEETKALRARAATLLNRLLTHFANQPLDGVRSGWKIIDPGAGYDWIKDGGKGRRMLAAMALVDTPEVRANILENLIWMQGSYGTQQGIGFNTDNYCNTTPQYLAAISSMRDCPAKWQRLVIARYAMEQSILVRLPEGTVSPEGGVIHHNFAHNAYASYEFDPMCRLLRDLNDCGVPSICDPDEVARRVARAGVAWAWIHQPATIVTNIEGRPSPPFVAQRDAVAKIGAEYHSIQAALTLLSYKRPATWREDVTRLLATALAKKPDTKIPAELEPFLDAAKQVTNPLSGSLAYPVSGAILQRRDNWLVSVRGAPPERRGGEGMPYAPWGHRITFGGLYCKGSLMLVGDGATPDAPADLVSSGQAADGREMSLMPGVTAPILPWEKMISKWHGSNATFSAPVALGGQGVWGFTTDSVAKSCFLFDNRITYATVLIPPSVAPAKKAKGPDALLATTFIQFRHADGANDPEFFDGKPLAHGAHVSLADNKPHTLLGTGGHGYYLHPTTELLELFRREQENHFSETAEGNVYKGNDTQSPRPEAMVTYKGDFTTGYWLHDTKATQHAPVVFTLLVKSGEAGFVNFVNRMRNPDTAPVRLTISPAAHILYDADTRMWGAVFFTAGDRGPGHDRNAACPVLAADRPCSVVMKPDQSSLTLSVSGGEEVKNPAPFTLTLKGSWRLPDGSAPEVASVRNAPSAGDTLLTVGASAPAGNAVRLIAR